MDNLRETLRNAGVPPASTVPKERSGWRSRGYLPHFDAPGLVQHIVFRLADSLPERFHDDIFKLHADERVPAIDVALDRGHGARALSDPRVAELVQGALLAFDATRYALLAWCVMPNHVYVLAAVKPECSLAGIIHSWKSYSAKRANRILGRTGAFWAKEYFDRFMRDDEHLATTAAYIEGNPVKAGLCQEVSDWRFSSAWHDWSGRDARGPHTAQPQ